MSGGRKSDKTPPETLVVRELQPEANIQIAPDLVKEAEDYERRAAAAARMKGREEAESVRKREDVGRAEDKAMIIGARFDHQEFVELLQAAEAIYQEKKKAMFDSWRAVASSIKKLSSRSRDDIFPTHPESRHILLPGPENSSAWLKGWKYRKPGFFGGLFGESSTIAQTRKDLETFCNSAVNKDWVEARQAVEFRRKQLQQSAREIQGKK